MWVRIERRRWVGNLERAATASPDPPSCHQLEKLCFFEGVGLALGVTLSPDLGLAWLKETLRESRKCITSVKVLVSPDTLFLSWRKEKLPSLEALA